MIEIWKDIIDYEGLYQVSNMGRVKSYDRLECVNGVIRLRKGKMLKLSKCTNGYLKVSLRPIIDTQYKLVHRLVAQTFIENEYNKLTVNHKDSNRENNNVMNLEWSTHSENMYHARTQGNAKFCYIEKPQEIKNINTGEIINFKNTTELCKFFGKSKCWLNNKRKQVVFPITVDGWCIK
jgi:hypothetical protein